MVWVTSGSVNDDWNLVETHYQTDYGRWNGFVSRIPVLRQIIDIRAAAVMSSWMTKGTHDKQAAKLLNSFSGRNSTETFRSILTSLYKISYICGDAYAEKILNDDDEIVDLEILPADNIRQIIERGKIIRYEEVDGRATFKPEKLFHLTYMPRGAMTHGIGMIESMNNLLISYEQMLQLGQEIYERMSKPRELILAKTDNDAKLQLIRNAIKDAGDTWSGIAVLPASLIDSIQDIQLSVSLKPQEWLDTLSKEFYKATATPELILGTGYSTSEEDAKTRIGGFRQSIRFDQKWLEESIKKQIFASMWPANPPDIEFSFATESSDEAFVRNLNSLPVIEKMQSVAPENKQAMVKERLIEMGMIQ